MCSRARCAECTARHATQTHKGQFHVSTKPVSAVAPKGRQPADGTRATQVSAHIPRPCHGPDRIHVRRTHPLGPARRKRRNRRSFDSPFALVRLPYIRSVSNRRRLSCLLSGRLGAAHWPTALRVPRPHHVPTLPHEAYSPGAWWRLLAHPTRCRALAAVRRDLRCRNVTAHTESRVATHWRA